MAIAFDSVSTSANMEDVGTATWSHTVGAGSDRVLLVGVRSRSFGSAPVVGSITYGGVSMSLQQATTFNYSGSSWIGVEVWKLVNPTVGTANVVVTATYGYDDASAVALSFTGVDPTTPIEAAGNTVASTAAATATASVTTLTANALVASFIYSRATSGTFAGTGTERDNVALTFEVTDFAASATQAVAVPAAITDSWTNLADAQSIGMAVSLKEFVAAAGDIPAFGRYRIAGARR
jgi:hypothetical protein